MDTVKGGFPTLDTLDTVSSAGLYPQMKGYWTLLVQLLESSWDSIVAKVESRITETKIGGLSWYVSQARAFQYGDAVSIVNGQVTYAVLDAEKLIVKQAAITEDIATGRLMLRVAKMTEGTIVPLSEGELKAFKAYAGKFKYAGVVLDVTSLEADQVKLVASVKVDRQILSDTGSLLTDNTKYPIKDGINAYLKSLPYDSIISNTGLTDAIQQIKGVKDFTINQSYTRRPVSVEWVSYAREVASTAGHGVLHNDSTFSYSY